MRLNIVQVVNTYGKQNQNCNRKCENCIFKKNCILNSNQQFRKQKQKLES